MTRCGRDKLDAARRRAAGFTLVEMFLVVAVLGLLLVMVLASGRRTLDAARQAACASNLRQLQAAFLLYLRDHQGRPFPYRENLPEGTLWYWGLEPAGASAGEGHRPLDPRRGRLAPYLGWGEAPRSCPCLPTRDPGFKRKFSVPSMGYGINQRLLEGMPGAIRNWSEVRNPANLLVWADAAQINTFQAPASPANPMLEEWYYISEFPPPSLHFRHGGRLNAAFGDGSVRVLRPGRLDPRCDGRVGYLDPGQARRILDPFFTE